MELVCNTLETLQLSSKVNMMIVMTAHPTGWGTRMWHISHCCPTLYLYLQLQLTVKPEVFAQTIIRISIRLQNNVISIISCLKLITANLHVLHGFTLLWTLAPNRWTVLCKCAWDIIKLKTRIWFFSHFYTQYWIGRDNYSKIYNDIV
jgi:hypothetical protein